MKILVTGGSGFIGTYLVTDLLEEGHDVVIYGRHKSQKYPDLCVMGDIRDKEKLAEAARGADAVYHLVAENRDNLQPPSLYSDINVCGAENVVSACEKNEIDKIIFTSTVFLYGLNPNGADENSPVNPFNTYGKGKYQAEIIFKKWAKRDDERCLTIVRPTVIFGEGNRGNVYNLLSQIASGRFVMVGSGKNKKSMAYVRNLSKFLTLMLNNKAGVHLYNYADKPDYTMEGLVKLVYGNISNGRSLKLRIPYIIGLMGGYAFDFLARVTGKNFPVSSIRIKKFCADTRINADKSKKTGFKAPYSLSEGLTRMIRNDFL